MSQALSTPPKPPGGGLEGVVVAGRVLSLVGPGGVGKSRLTDEFALDRRVQCGSGHAGRYETSLVLADRPQQAHRQGPGADPRLDDFRNLNSIDRRPDLPSGKGLVIAEGVLVVQRMLASRFTPRALLGTDRRLAELGG